MTSPAKPYTPHERRGGAGLPIRGYGNPLSSPPPCVSVAQPDVVSVAPSHPSLYPLPTEVTPPPGPESPIASAIPILPVGVPPTTPNRGRVSPWWWGDSIIRCYTLLPCAFSPIWPPCRGQWQSVGWAVTIMIVGLPASLSRVRRVLGFRGVGVSGIVGVGVSWFGFPRVYPGFGSSWFGDTVAWPEGIALWGQAGLGFTVAIRGVYMGRWITGASLGFWWRCHRSCHGGWES